MTALDQNLASQIANDISILKLQQSAVCADTLGDADIAFISDVYCT